MVLMTVKGVLNVKDVEMKEDILNKILDVIYLNELANIIELMQYFVVCDDVEAKFGVSDIRQLNKIIGENTEIISLYLDGNYQRRKRQQNSIYDEEDEL